MSLKQLTQARWFPTVSKPVISGLLASAVVFGLHAVGITHFTSNEMNAAITPLAGFLVTMIVDKEKGAPAPDAPADSVGRDLAQVLLPDIEQALAASPNLRRQFLIQMLAAEQTTAPPVTVAVSPPPPDNPGFVR